MNARHCVQPGQSDSTLQDQCEIALRKLAGFCEPDELAAIKPLARALRDARLYPLLLGLTEAIARRDPDDAGNRCLQAQALIEIGQASVAVDVLEALLGDLAHGDREWPEAKGLLGRAWKQIFFDSADKSTEHAHAAIAAAVAAYREPFETDRSRGWHGVNLLALLHRARRMGLSLAPEISVARLARGLLEDLLQIPAGQRDEWFFAMLAQAALGLDDWDQGERCLRDYAGQPGLSAFALASTLRQLSEVWDLECSERGRALLDVLRARLLQLPEAELTLAPAEVRRLQSSEPPTAVQLEALLGKDGPQTYEWWLAGIKRARSVAAVKRRFGARCGTGFLVRAGDLGLSPADELLVLTNYHVINEAGRPPGIRPNEAEVVFEAVEGSPRFEVEQIVWSASTELQDASLLRLHAQPSGIDPLPVARSLPSWPPPDAKVPTPRVYLIGHPGGRELAFSFQDNELLGHEGPPAGRPPFQGVCRVHYRAPTEGGSSGSPVFDDRNWEVVALHHMGGQIGMPRLNGESGSYAANEGIAIDCIVAAIARRANDG